MRPIATILLLITFSWATLLAVLAAISAIILPLASGVEGRLAASLLRLFLSLSLFAIWLAWIFELTRYTFIRLSRGGSEVERK